MQQREEALAGVAEPDVERLLEQVPTLKLSDTTDVPEQYTGVRGVDIESPEYFTVILDGVRRRTKSLKVRHPKDLTVYEITGMRSVSYRAPEDSKFPSADAVEVQLNPRNGALAVTSYATVPEEQLLNSPETTGKTVYRHRYTDPRQVLLDGKDFPNVQIVQVKGLREAEVKLYMQ